MVENNPTVSVIIPTYNRAHLVGRAIKSVLNQTYQDFELIIVDDGSTDNTEKVIKRFDDKRIRYIKHEKNKGGAAARNTGIKAARGEYIAFLDSDDEWLPEKLKRQMEVFKNASSEVGVVYTGFIYVDKLGGGTSKQHIPKKRGWIYEDILVENCIGTTSTVLIERKYFKETGLFDENLPSCQDWDMWIRLAKQCKFDFIPEILVRYFEHRNRITSNCKSVIEGHEAILRKFQNDIEKRGHKVKAKHYFRLGNYLCHSREMKLGKQYLFQAFLSYPWNPKHFLYFFVSIFGGKMYLKIAQIKRQGKQILHSFLNITTPPVRL